MLPHHLKFIDMLYDEGKHMYGQMLTSHAKATINTMKVQNEINVKELTLKRTLTEEEKKKIFDEKLNSIDESKINSTNTNTSENRKKKKKKKKKNKKKNIKENVNI